MSLSGIQNNDLALSAGGRISPLAEIPASAGMTYNTTGYRYL